MSPQTLQNHLFADRVDCIKSAQVVSIGLKSIFDSKRGEEGKRMSEKMIVACPECETRFVAPLEKFLPDGRKVRCAKCGHSWFQQLESANAPSAVTSVDAPVETPPKAPAESIMDRAAQATAAQPDARILNPTVQSERMTEASREAIEGASQAATSEVSHNASHSSAGATAITAAVATGAGAIGAHSLRETTDLGRVDSVHETDDHQPISMNEPKRPRKRSLWPRAILYSVAAAIIAGALGYFFKDEISSQVPALDPSLTTWKKTVDGVVSKAVPSNRALRIENVKYDLNESDGEPAMLLTADVANESGSAREAPKLSATIYAADNALLKTVSVSPEEPVSKIEAQTSLTYFLRLPYPPENMDRVEVDFSE